jgi:GNAT superfamily N-acetyltransferase
MITGNFGSLGGLDPKAFDFEGRRWERFFEGEFSQAKQIMARLEAEDVPNRMTFPETQPTPTTVVVEVMRRWLPRARELLDETLIYLEMTSPSQLVPGRSPPASLEMQEVDRAAASVLRSTYVRIGDPYGWTGRSSWSDAQWEAELSRPGIRAWIARVDDDVAGLVELEAEPNGDVGIVVLGLVPEFVGKGFGGQLLTLATRLAWNITSPGGASPRRVWVQTSSHDHPHASSNYEHRGFRTFRTERRSLANPPGSS